MFTYKLTGIPGPLLSSKTGLSHTVFLFRVQLSPRKLCNLLLFYDVTAYVVDDIY